MYGFEPIPGRANGTINPSRFVKLDTSADGRFLQAGTNDLVEGIASEAARDAPIDGASGVAASADDQITYYPEGNVALVEIGSGGVTRGAEVKSDTDGKAVLAAQTGTTEQNVAGIAMESGAAGEFRRVKCKVYRRYPALS